MSYVLLLRGAFYLIHGRSFLRQAYKQFVDESIQIAVPNLRRATTATKTGLHTLQLTTKSAILDDIAFQPAVLVSGWPSRHAQSYASLCFGFRQSEWFAFVDLFYQIHRRNKPNSLQAIQMRLYSIEFSLTSRRWTC